MTNLEIIQDRTFDASCLYAKGENELADSIVDKLRQAQPEYLTYIDDCLDLYKKATALIRASSGRTDYLIKNKDNLRLRFR